MPSKVGDARKRHPTPLRLRNPNIKRDDGGGKGYRGRGFPRMRQRVLRRDRFRSSATGLGRETVTLTVDHIIPYRLGLTPITNTMQALRTTDSANNPAMDVATTFKEKKIRRRLRTF